MLDRNFTHRGPANPAGIPMRDGEKDVKNPEGVLQAQRAAAQACEISLLPRGHLLSATPIAVPLYPHEGGFRVLDSVMAGNAIYSVAEA